MKKALFLASILAASVSCTTENKLEKAVDNALSLAQEQYVILTNAADKHPGMLPKTFMKDSLAVAVPEWWTSGFVPGTLWYLYEASNDPKMKELALRYTQRVERIQYYTENHDLGFMIYCPYGNAVRLDSEKAEDYNKIIVQASKSLSTRYRENMKLIRSWDFNEDAWQYPVIIDNMMNLEMMCAATEISGDSSFYKIAVNHADKTMQYHFRENMSTYHVVSYDTISGLPHASQTWQGFDDDSEWSRGQTWALYGYTMMYRMTKEQRYLDHAVKVTEYLINHPNMPADMIPYWDFCDPKIATEPSKVYRDASAAAVMSSGLFELIKYVDADKAKKYREIAELQLMNLCGPEYLAEKGEIGGFILRHGVGSLPHGSEIDVPLTYGDYYFIEAALRYKALLKNN